MTAIDAVFCLKRVL